MGLIRELKYLLTLNLQLLVPLLKSVNLSLQIDQLLSTLHTLLLLPLTRAVVLLLDPEQLSLLRLQLPPQLLILLL